MSKMEYLVVHCTDTPYDSEVTPDDIHLWHKGMLNHGDGTVTYLGKKMKLAEINGLKMKLPSGRTVTVKSTNGRGWSQVGYADLINRKGEVINLVPYNNDDVIDSVEITNGATGYNAKSRHVVLAGGWDASGIFRAGLDRDGNWFIPEQLYKAEQLVSLKSYFDRQKNMVELLKIVGHNEVAEKPCPNFQVQPYLARI